ncbi:hypothetical protein DSO57_1011265 [Entomophthora muscae]|uniref:Uncharacterized protein n=1 Tax=Entomophthora muscae TaxID=34485 RepID=A0ACC2RXE3_9FUNG|nr:hypothetical protein DSO57_1011265 [Entomophthora muscae]
MIAIILQAHIDTGHGGIAKNHDCLCKNFYWENMRLLIPDCGDPHVCCFAVRVDLASNKDGMLKSDNVWLADDAAWLVGNKGLPEADVASTQQKMLAALGYSASPSSELWLQEGEY